MRLRNVLDELALQHRELHDASDALLAAAAPSDEDVCELVAAISRHEAIERVLVLPLLERHVSGAAVDRSRQANHQLLSSRITAVVNARDQQERRETLERLHPALVGQTDRDEIETYPLVRYVVTPEELHELEGLRQRLEAALVRETPSLCHDERPLEATERRAQELVHHHAGISEELRVLVVPDLSPTTRSEVEEPPDG